MKLCTFGGKYAKAFIKDEVHPFNPLYFPLSPKQSTKVKRTLVSVGTFAFFCFAAKEKLGKEKGLHFSGVVSGGLMVGDF